MKALRYVGRDDAREFSPEDLDRLGVEGAETPVSFKSGESTALEDEVADVLLGKVRDLREATPEELEEEERQLEAQLGFAPYDPSDHTVEEVKTVLANSNDERRKYILDRERAGSNRKTIFAAVGAEWQEKPEEVPAEEAPDASALDADTPMDPATAEAMQAAGGHETTELGGTGGVPGTTGGANTSSSAGTGRASTA